MDHPLTLTVPVIGGRTAPTDHQLGTIRAWLQPLDGKHVTLKLSKPKQTRSLKANAYYWGVFLTTVATDTGNSTEDLHFVLKDLLLPRKFITLGNKSVEIKKSTVDLNPSEFALYLDQCIAWAAQTLGIAIPEPSGNLCVTKKAKAPEPEPERMDEPADKAVVDDLNNSLCQLQDMGDLDDKAKKKLLKDCGIADVRKMTSIQADALGQRLGRLQAQQQGA